MSRVIQDLLIRHFRFNTLNGRENERDVGRQITEDEAVQFASHLSARQLGAVDAGAIKALDDLFTESSVRQHSRFAEWKDELISLEAFRWWKDLRSPDRERAWITLAIIRSVLDKNRRLNDHYCAQNGKLYWHVGDMVRIVGKRTLKFEPEQILIAIETSKKESTHTHSEAFDYALLPPVLNCFDVLHGFHSLSNEDRSFLEGVRNQLERDSYRGDSRLAAATLSAILGETDRDLLWNGEAWAAQINESVRTMPATTKATYLALLKHAGSIGFTKPSKLWLAAAQSIGASLDPSDCSGAIGRWVEAFIQSKCVDRAKFHEDAGGRYTKQYFDQAGRFGSNHAYLTGIVYLAKLFPSAHIVSLLGDLVEFVSHLKHEIRQQCVSSATAAIRVLDLLDTDEAMAVLCRAEMRVRWPKLRKLLTQTLEKAISRRGGSRDELEELVVPDFGMRDAAVRVPVGDGNAVLAMDRGDRPTTAWHVPDKPPSHVVPKSLREKSPDSVAAIKSLAIEIEKMHAAQRTRLDLLFRKPRDWSAEEWKQRYVNHGLLSGMCRRLIWQIGEVSAIWNDSVFETDEGRAVDITSNSRVSLWHPATHNPAEVVRWRTRLEANGIVQPIKQAHREIYLLTDAERKTRTYSNRFAAHILKNQTTLAITQVRKWKMGLYGGASSPSFFLPGFGLRAEWWVNPAGEETDRMGFPLYMVSDQVRFYRGESDEPMALEEVPALALTEIMRDVDLFVSVASVGNNPNWSDGGPEGRYQSYWHKYSFGDLAESAKTRKAVLERLIPRLKIASQCSFSDKFLIVRGQKRTYKIHLGSGNILMEPNDQYLCIVPDSRARAQNEDVFLPFEGDNTLSIILSKAILLAEDTKIKDPTITRQIG